MKSPFFNELKQKERILLFLCLVVGFGLRLYTLDQKSLWVDEIHTFNDSRYGLKGQLEFYKENPTYLQAPLFFVLSHLFYPFSKPERDLRILPLIFGVLSIPMLYLLARLFSPLISIPCAISLTFMTYHISLSQDGRSYALLMFLGMAGLYFLMKHLQTLKRRYLYPGALFFALLVYTSYSSIPFMIFSQLLWFYRMDNQSKKPSFVSFLLFNGFILLLCMPWILFLALNFTGQWVPQVLETKVSVSLMGILYGIFHDWVPYAPLMISSAICLALAPFISEKKKRMGILLSIFFLPIVGIFAFSKLINNSHFITSRYFIAFLPIFLISLYLSLHHLENKLPIRRKWIGLRTSFLLLFIATNMMILPLYYHSEKQDFRRLVAYLKTNLREGDKIFDADRILVGLLHYFRVPPEGRTYQMDYVKESSHEAEYRKSFTYQDRTFTIYHSTICCNQYLADGNRLWVIARLPNAKRFKRSTPSVLMGYFDGSFLNLERFPVNGSMYLLLWDPKSPNGKGIDLPLE